MAAGVWDRMLAFLGFEEELDEEDEAEALAASGGRATAAQHAYAGRQAMNAAVLGEAAAGGGRADAGRRRAARTPSRSMPADDRGSEVRPAMRAGTVTRLWAAAPGIVVSAPRRFEDSQEAADHLKAGQPVILHLEGMDRDLAQKVTGFLSGSVYALGGEMHRVGSVVIFAPAGFEVTLPLSLRMAERDNR